MSYDPSYGEPAPPPIIVRGPQTSSAAVASLVFGIIGMVAGCCTFGVPSILAVLLGHAALRETRNGQKAGHGMAIAGLILGYILVIPMIFLSVMMFFGAGLDALNPSNPQP